MVPIRFTSLVLGLLFTLLAPGNSISHTQQAVETMMVANGNGLAATGGNAVSVDHQELLDGIPAIAVARNEKLGGRKMMVNNDMRKEIREEEGLNRETTKISGKGKNNASDKSLGKSQKSMNDQNTVNMLEPKTLNSGRMEIPGSEPVDLPNTNKLTYSQDSEAISECGRLECSSKSKKSVSQEADDHDPFQKIESQKLLEAANEIVNLIHKDYVGMNKPRRKPPINNYEPLDEEHLKP